MRNVENSSHNPVGRKRRPSLPNPPPRVNPYVAAQNRRMHMELMAKKEKRFLSGTLYFSKYVIFRMTCLIYFTIYFFICINQQPLEVNKHHTNLQTKNHPHRHHTHEI